ncbi:hypothetical protein BX666DRAFT_1894817 [Dichotomocladium elegans]|nr:hypothetical protein BX666DRAFT_1894817 [Dichotomocladium elegans]
MSQTKKRIASTLKQSIQKGKIKRQMYITRISSCRSCICLFIFGLIICQVLASDQSEGVTPDIKNNNRRGVLHGDAGTPPPNGAASRPMPTSYPYPYPYPPPQILTVTKTIFRTATQLPTVSPHGMSLSSGDSSVTSALYSIIVTIVAGVALVYL